MSSGRSGPHDEDPGPRAEGAEGPEPFSGDGWVEVPVERLSAEALLGLIDAFVLAEGTDYGHEETSLEAKRRDVRRQLDDRSAVIVFDLATEQIDLRMRRDLAR